MTVTILPIERRRGDTWDIRVTITDEDENPISVTGSAFQLIVDETQFPDPGSTATRKFVLIGAIFDAPLGVVDFPVPQPAADTAPGDYYYFVKMTASNGKTITVATERFSLR